MKIKLDNHQNLNMKMTEPSSLIYDVKKLQKISKKYISEEVNVICNDVLKNDTRETIKTKSKI